VGAWSNPHTRIIEYDAEIAGQILDLLSEGSTGYEIVRENLTFPNMRTMRKWRHGLYGAPPEFASEWIEATGDLTHSLAGAIPGLASTIMEDVLTHGEDALERFAENPNVERPELLAAAVMKMLPQARALHIKANEFVAGAYNPKTFGSHQSISHDIPQPIKTIDLSKLPTELLEKVELLGLEVDKATETPNEAS